MHNVSYAVDVIRKKNLDIKAQISKNFDMNHLNYKILTEIKETYYYNLKHYLKKKDMEQYTKGINEFDKYLDDFYEYDYYYNIEISKLPSEIISKFTKSEVLQAELIKSSPTLNALFNEFKFKKCDDIFMNMSINQSIFDKCKDTVIEREKMLTDLDKDYLNLKARESRYKKIFEQVTKVYANYIKPSNGQFYFLSVVIFIIAMTVIVAPFYSK